MRSEVVDLNNELKRREKEEFYEDKLLELKMQEFLDKYLTENELSKYKDKLNKFSILILYSFSISGPIRSFIDIVLF